MPQLTPQTTGMTTVKKAMKATTMVRRSTMITTTTMMITTMSMMGTTTVESRSLGTVDVGGTTLDVSMSGDLDPGAEVHIDLEHTGGSPPAAIRLWIGDEAGTGALKSKADGHDDHFHGHAEAPTDLLGAALWIEVEMADGTRTSSSLPLD